MSDFDHAKIGELPDYNPADELKTMTAVLAFVHDIDETDEYATIVAMLETAHEAAARILEESIREEKA